MLQNTNYFGRSDKNKIKTVGCYIFGAVFMGLYRVLCFGAPGLRGSFAVCYTLKQGVCMILN